MTAAPKRLGVKFHLRREPSLQPADILPIFQRWIQQHTVPGMLIDVIDYKHVPEGPGLILVADEGDYAYDLGDGRTGLHYIRKRALPDDLSDALALAFRHALEAALALQGEAPGDIVFDFTQAKISFFDRQRYRNQPALYDELRPELGRHLAQIYGVEVALSRSYDDPRQTFALTCQAQGAVDAADLLASLKAHPPGV